MPHSPRRSRPVGAAKTGGKPRPCYASTAAQPVATAPPRGRPGHVGRARGDREGTPILAVRIPRSLPAPATTHVRGRARRDVGPPAGQRVLFLGKRESP